MLFLNKARLVASVLAIVVAAGLYILLERTRLGRAVRAAADNPTAATYAGVDVGRAHRIAFGLGSAVTALWGGLTVGFVQQFSALVLPPQQENAAIFVVFLLIVTLRPQGFFGRSAERA